MTDVDAVWDHIHHVAAEGEGAWLLSLFNFFFSEVAVSELFFIFISLTLSGFTDWLDTASLRLYLGSREDC